MESVQWDINAIAQVIEISIAPVFLLAGISGLLMVMTNRLARTIDRSRSLQAAITSRELPEHQAAFDREMDSLLKRGWFINLAIYLATVSALLVCLVIIALFLGSLVDIHIAKIVASLFIVCMIILSAALTCFLAEVFIATRRLRETLVSTNRFLHPS